SNVLNGINLNPSIYYYRDFILQQNTVEYDMSYTWDMSSLTGVQGISLVPGATVGYLNANNYLGQVFTGTGSPWRNSYTYYGFQLNLNYKINSWCTAFVGLRWAGNNDGTGIAFGAPVQAPGSNSSIWGGAGLKFGM
ncbi:MAG: hypothetical protein ABSH19_04850, partial [Opitutales bacterium]